MYPLTLASPAVLYSVPSTLLYGPPVILMDVYNTMAGQQFYQMPHVVPPALAQDPGCTVIVDLNSF